jgi:hypothetical protein
MRQRRCAQTAAVVQVEALQAGEGRQAATLQTGGPGVQPGEACEGAEGLQVLVSDIRAVRQAEVAQALDAGQLRQACRHARDAEVQQRQAGERGQQLHRCGAPDGCGSKGGSWVCSKGCVHRRQRRDAQQLRAGPTCALKVQVLQLGAALLKGCQSCCAQ